jgi:hypothetical protein
MMNPEAEIPLERNFPSFCQADRVTPGFDISPSHREDWGVKGETKYSLLPPSLQPASKTLGLGQKGALSKPKPAQNETLENLQNEMKLIKLGLEQAATFSQQHRDALEKEKVYLVHEKEAEKDLMY